MPEENRRQTEIQGNALNSTETKTNPYGNPIVLEQYSQSIEIAIVADKAGEIVEVYDRHLERMSAWYSRNSRKLNKQKKRHDQLQTWRETRKINSIDDVRSKTDLESLLGDHTYHKAKITDCGMELLHNPENRLSKRAISLAMMLMLNHLVAWHYAIASNEEIKRLIDDKSGNYTKYLNELIEVNFCTVKNIGKSLKLITINPIYGSKGGIDPYGRATLRGLRSYYPKHSPMFSSRQNYEDDLLQAA